MFDYQFPTWLPIVFFVVLLTGAFLVGKWLVKNDRGYNGISWIQKLFKMIGL